MLRLGHALYLYLLYVVIVIAGGLAVTTIAWAGLAIRQWLRRARGDRTDLPSPPASVH